ncbi:hypothetical protein DIU31_003810 [Mucilaginibacter rubeus]|uniref:Uncharacterized protein n=1 Tax=Mucilaginibacter rubeus TaxID=2027860 RepID=A0AAE6JBM6_9SPHI|nr:MULTISPECIES: hypothetical protein [Mucilaginibacter]QEM02684.1 hypothetical protein DIU31_003810 [Mucilaginibacter rubeus]QEM15304.1 hypothetical protein DIU38_003855 [Mucilaginibacter gossypii]QTE41968.1 hypothetical protein J3L19_23950 [Mucilaginibacter rubeus]QTE48569.1 hypothetical protein J3L21_23930 [Mucilaginibacter rubeus]QTE59956.1 hypothetical protein J3L23_15565 [Mucilaginibacter rubeus]
MTPAGQFDFDRLYLSVKTLNKIGEEGAIKTVSPVIQNTGEKSLKTLTLYINPDAKDNATGELYWDKDEGWDLRKSSTAKSNSRQQKAATKLRCVWLPRRAVIPLIRRLPI